MQRTENLLQSACLSVSVVCSMLLTIVGNVVDHPGEAKYRRIRRASTVFQQSLGSLPGGCKSLQAIGFTIQAEPTGEEVRATCRSVAAEWDGAGAGPQTYACVLSHRMSTTSARRSGLHTLQPAYSLAPCRSST